MSEAPAPPDLLPTTYKHEIKAGVSISGRLSFPGDARVDGQLRGEVRAHALLVVGPSAQLYADIEARRLLVQGTVVGNVRASTEVELAPGGRVIGDVEAAHLVVHEGAVLEGRCLVGSAQREGASFHKSRRPRSGATQRP